MNSDNQMEVTVYYVPQEYEMEYIKYCIPVNLHYIVINA